jgi:hypothetical protein
VPLGASGSEDIGLNTAISDYFKVFDAERGQVIV